MKKQENQQTTKTKKKKKRLFAFEAFIINSVIWSIFCQSVQFIAFMV